MRLLRFTIDEHRYGVAGDAVAEIVRAVAVTPLPRAPAVIRGIIDVRGTIVPVFDLRRRFGIPERPVAPADHFILVRTSSRVAALHVDTVTDLVDVDDRATTDSTRQVTGAAEVAGVATLPDGLVLIHDVETFLSRAESDTLSAALDAQHGTITSRS
jgi:purine-binding chemotaxis protein CheW